MDSNEKQTFWFDKPKWDAQNSGWYWEGYVLEDNEHKLVTRYLGPHEFGPDGRPRQDATPPKSTSAPRFDSWDPSHFSPGQQTVRNPISSSTGRLDIFDSSPRSFPDYKIHGGILKQEAPGSSTGGRKHHTKHSNRKSSYTQGDSLRPFGHHYNALESTRGSALPTQLEASFQQMSLQNYGAKQTESSFGPITPTSAFGRGNQTHNADPYGPEAAPCTARLGHTGLQQSSEQEVAGYQPVSSYYNNVVPTNPVYGAEVHTGARWAGGPPSHGFAGQPSTRVKQKAPDKNKPIRRNNSQELLDPNFYVHHSSNFQPGKIIKVFWSEPKGTSIRGFRGSRLSSADTLLKDHMKDFWTGWRRFIIIRNFEGHCHCVPIYSYEGQACNKRGVKHSEHGVIYEDAPGSTGSLLPNEKPLGFPPIRARTTNGKPMNNASRVNYAKVTDIAHNLKVNFIAEVVPEDWNIAKDALKLSGFC